MKTNLTALMAVAIALTACSAATAVATNPDALAHGAAVKTLDAGKFNSLPTGSIYVRMIRFAQPVGYVIHSKQHVSSVIYIEFSQSRLPSRRSQSPKA